MAKHKENAREKLLAAMFQIVQEQGANYLTYDNLVSKSGLTRGGVMYHFPSKKSMLQGLVDHYMSSGLNQVEARWEKFGKTPDTMLKAEIEVMLEMNMKDREAPSVLLPVIINNPEMIGNIRKIVEQRYKVLEQTKMGFERAALIAMALDCFGMSQAFGMHLMSDQKRKKLLSYMLRLVDQKETL